MNGRIGICEYLVKSQSFPGGSAVKNLLCRRPRFDPGSGRSTGEGNGNPCQYSCLGNPMDRGTWVLESMGLQESNTT